MATSTHSSWSLALQTALLVTANTALAWVLAAVVFGPIGATVAALIVAGLALAMPGLRQRGLGGSAQALPVDHWVSRVVATLAVRAGLPNTPDAYLIPGQVANALAMGDGRKGAVAITEGALHGLDDEEIGGVLAHEVSHLAHGDTRLLAISATAGRLTSILSQLTVVLILVSLPLILTGRLNLHPFTILLVIAAPTLTVLLQLALSRTREFAADRRAAALIGDPRGLARALHKIDQTSRRMLPPWLTPYVGQEHPWLRSHPATGERIRQLLTIPVDPSVPPLPPRRNPARAGGSTVRRLLRFLFRGW